MIDSMGKGANSGGTGSAEVARFLNKNYSLFLYARSISVSSSDAIPQYIRSRMAFGDLIMPAVNIISGSQHNPDGGKLGVGGASIDHWVLITGISKQWKDANKISPWNWVRIYNPFDNETEYYWGKDFIDAWDDSFGDFDGVLIMPFSNKYKVKIR